MLEEDPEDPFLHYALGLEEYKLLHYQDALQHFNTCIEKDESYLPVYYQISKVFIELDITDVAKSYIQKGMELATDLKDLKTKSELTELMNGLE